VKGGGGGIFLPPTILGNLADIRHSMQHLQGLELNHRQLWSKKYVCFVLYQVGYCIYTTIM